MILGTVSDVLTIFMALIYIAWAALSLPRLLRWLKWQKRVAFLRAHPDEIPLYPEQPPPLVRNPPVLVRTLSWKGHKLLFACWFGIVVVFGVVGLFLAPATSTSLADTLFGEAVLFGSFSALMLFFHILFAVMSYQRIEAGETALIVQRWLIRRRISWDQARLFAVDHKKNDQKNVVSNWDELSGSGKVVRWEYNAEIPRGSVFQFSPGNYPQELAYLRSYILARTDLPLRDLRSLRE